MKYKKKQIKFVVLYKGLFYKGVYKHFGFDSVESRKFLIVVKNKATVNVS